MRRLLVLCLLPLLAGCGTTVATTAVPTTDGLVTPIAVATAGPGDAPAPDTGGPSAVGPVGRAGDAPDGGSVSGAQAAVPATGPSVALTGPGWDARNVYVGVSTADDAKSAVAKLGYELPIGDARAITNAIVADLNARGGILGRRVVPVFRDHSSADIAREPQIEAQADCAYFSSDRPVIAYLDSSLGQSSGIAECMHRAGVPFFDLNSAVYDEADFRRLGPHLWGVRSPSVTSLIPLWSQRLQAQGYFSGWDSLNGAPGTARPRVGLYLEDNPRGRRIAAAITAALPASMRNVTSYFYAPTIGQNDASSAVLRFTSADVTHVLTLPSAAGAWALFTLAAENQHYRPRYGLTSYDWLQFAVQNLPHTQLVGSMGVGWLPVWDVDASHQPAGPPGMPRCRAALAKAGQAGQEANAAPACDALYLLADATKAASSLGASALRKGILRIGPTLATAGTFRSGLSTTNPGLPGAVRDVAFADACSCYVYRGADRAV